MARLSEHTDAPETRDSPPRRGVVPTIVVLLVCLAGLTALVCTLLGSISVGLVAGLSVLVVALGLFAWIARRPRSAGPEDGSRRRFLQIGLGGVALVGAGAALGRVVEKGLRPDAIAVENAAADDLGADYMELIARAATRRALRRPPAPARAVQQRELFVRIARLAPARSAHQPRVGVDVPGARPAGRARARAASSPPTATDARHARRPRADHRAPDGIHRLARAIAKERSCPGSDDRRATAQGHRDVRDRRRRMERAAALARQLAEPQAPDGSRASTTGTRSPAPSPP